MVEWAAILLRIREVQVSNLGWKSTILTKRFLCFFISSSKQIRELKSYIHSLLGPFPVHTSLNISSFHAM
jgi:hypothetical protein